MLFLKLLLSSIPLDHSCSPLDFTTNVSCINSIHWSPWGNYMLGMVQSMPFGPFFPLYGSIWKDVFCCPVLLLLHHLTSGTIHWSHSFTRRASQYMLYISYFPRDFMGNFSLVWIFFTMFMTQISTLFQSLKPFVIISILKVFTKYYMSCILLLNSLILTHRLYN